MTVLALLVLPVLGYATFRSASAYGLSRPWSVATGAVVAVALTLAPLALFRTSPPNERVSAPRGTAETLEVIFGEGWQPVVRDERQRLVRWMSGPADVVVGQLVASRPPAQVSLRVEGLRRPRRLTVSFGSTVLAFQNVPTDGTVVRVRVPPGEGPAVLRFNAEPGAEGPTLAALAESLTVTRLPSP